MNLFFRAVPLLSSEARLEAFKIGDISLRKEKEKWSKKREHFYVFIF